MLATFTSQLSIMHALLLVDPRPGVEWAYQLVILSGLFLFVETKENKPAFQCHFIHLSSFPIMSYVFITAYRNHTEFAFANSLQANSV